MGHTRDKISRLGEVEDLLLSHPGGMTQAELARRLGVNRGKSSAISAAPRETAWKGTRVNGGWTCPNAPRAPTGNLCVLCGSVVKKTDRERVRG
jgi:hypothetical protein